MIPNKKGMMPLAIFAIVALLGVIVMFSGTNGLTGYATACVQDRPDCAAGKICEASKCVAGCRDGANCASGKFCINSKCVPPPTTCQDSDGLDQFVSGSAQLFKSGAPKGNPKADVCKQGKPATGIKLQTPAKLTEYTCSPPDLKGNQKIVSNKIVCPDFACNGNGCHQPGTPAQFPDNNACIAGVECASTSCINGKCGKLRANGLNCNANEECASGLCGAVPLYGSTSTSNRCLGQNLPDGQACLRGTECASGGCVPRMPAGTGGFICGQPRAHGELCFGTGTGQCQTGMICTSSTYGLCAYTYSSRNAGDSCLLNQECRSGKCISGICKISSGACTANNQCVSGICRTDGVCYVQPTSGTTSGGSTTGGTTTPPAPSCTPSSACGSGTAGSTVVKTNSDCTVTRVYCYSQGGTCQNGQCVGVTQSCSDTAPSNDPYGAGGTITYGANSALALDACRNSGTRLQKLSCVGGVMGQTWWDCTCTGQTGPGAKCATGTATPVTNPPLA